MRPEIARDFGQYVVPGKSYPRPLPADLDDWYCYVIDSGHCIAAMLPGREQYGVIPVAVKTVLRGYTVNPNGFIVVDWPYDSTRGLRTPPGDEEF